MIKPETIEEIRNIPLDVAIGKYVADLKKSGSGYKAKSPFGEENTPSFFVHVAKGFWKDFHSGKGGRDVISFVAQQQGMTWIDAVRFAAADFNINIVEDNSAEAQAWKEKLEKKKELQPVMDWAYSEFQKNDVPTDFLKRFPLEVCEAHHIGYCTSLIGEARKIGYTCAQLFECGLVNKHPDREEYFERFADRVIFPVMDWRDSLIGFTGRINGKVTAKQAKYMHSAFEKSKTLYGINKAKKAMQAKDVCYVVEGPTDCIRFHQQDITNAVAKQGAHLSDDQAKLIKRFCGTVCFIPDNDADKKENTGMKSLDADAETAIKAGLTVKVLMIKPVK